MKTKFILLVLLFALLPVTVIANSTKQKKVAITEVVDASGKVAESTKKYIISALTDSIMNIGYEVYVLKNEANIEQQNIDYILTVQVNLISKSFALLDVRMVERTTARVISSRTSSSTLEENSLHASMKKLINKFLEDLRKE
ncbi:MAG: hypothetical protein IKL50_02370 [Bacteroidales bacterium]|nr:hypothetical protein [Bacteroidales bacterium]